VSEPREVRLLYTGFGSPSTPAVLEALSRSRRYRARIIATDMQPLAGNLYLAQVERRHLVPRAGPSLAYVDAVCDLIKREGAEVYLSTCEEEYIWIAEHRTRLERLGCRLFLPPYEALAVAYDKRRTYRALREAGYAFPLIPTVDEPRPEDAASIWDRFDGDAILKATDHSGAREIHLPEDAADLGRRLADAQARGIDCIVQRFLRGAEWNVSTLHDHEGRLIYAVPRRKIEDRPIKSSTLAAVIEDHDAVRTAGLEVVERLGLTPGFNNVELLDVDGEPYLIEVNGGRIAAQDGNLVAAGINLADLFLDLVFDRPVDPVATYRRGVVSLKIRVDVITTIDALLPAAGQGTE